GKNNSVAVFEVLDYHTEETFPHLAEVLSVFEQGVKNYQNRAWGQALNCFERALEYNPHDGPSRLYLERCKHCLESPPADSWDGVWTMQQK
ncbi:MAG: adenylate/guanylate cyclase domain-containing protein, partial [Deltaproteobacteria bacterium]|nr:adenylate/guanylate cyclase domain-containing protein [Deltaproteobacteria bacterium]